MVQAASDRVWESRRILLTARPGPPPKSKNQNGIGIIVKICNQYHNDTYIPCGK